MREIRWVPVVLVAMVSAACAEAKEPSRPSLLDDLPQLAPAIACIDAAPLDDETALKACVERTGLSFKDITHEPKSLNDFKANILMLWIVTNRGADRQKNTASFAEAIDYARCVEKSAYSDKEFSSRTEKGVAGACRAAMQGSSTVLAGRVSARRHPSAQDSCNDVRIRCGEHGAELCAGSQWLVPGRNAPLLSLWRRATALRRVRGQA